MPLNSSLQRSPVRTAMAATVGVFFIWGLVAFLQHTLLALTLSATALMLSIALDHPVKWMEGKNLPRWVAIVVVTLLTLGFFVGSAFLLLPPVIDQGKGLVADLPTIFRGARSTHWFHQLDARFHVERRILGLEQRIPSLLEDAAGPFLSVVSGLLSFVAAILSVSILAVFMLVFGARLVSGAVDVLSTDYREHARVVVTKFYESIGGYVGGLLLICGINATLTTTFLAILRVPFFLPLGLLSGFSSLVPYAGPLISGGAISLVALATGGWVKGLATAIYFLAYGQLEGNVLSPLIFRRTVHVNPLIVTLSVLFFGELAGVVGAVLAVPTAAALQILTREYLRLRRETADAGTHERPTG